MLFVNDIVLINETRNRVLQNGGQVDFVVWGGVLTSQELPRSEDANCRNGDAEIDV